MVITELLEKNARLYGKETALVEINPTEEHDAAHTWREFNLIEADAAQPYRREITWRDFDVRANRFANLLLTRHVKKGDKVALVGFGTFEARKRGARVGRNPQTKETIKIPASKVPAFKAGKGFKDAVAK